MKARATWLAIPLMAGVAFAQSASGSAGQAQGAAQADKAGQQAGSTAGAPAEMKTMTYRGTLVDLACGSATASAGAGQSDPTTGSANRSSGGDCAVTANSTQLGLKTDAGQVYRFDLVGNQRAQDALKANKSWNKSLTANKPLKVKISGVLQGDKLIVSSIQ